MEKHILVISQYFYPEQFRINDITAEWVKRGYNVTVLTGIPNYPKGTYFSGYGLFKHNKDVYKGVQIKRLPLIPRGNKTIMLVLNYFSFVISGYIWNIFTKISADMVFIYEVSPMTQALPGIWYARKRKIPCFLYVQDLWPENVEIITGIKNKAIIKCIGNMVDYIYAHCTKIFASSKSFVQSIANRGVPIEKIEYWPQYAEDFYTPIEKIDGKINNHNSFKIIYTGNIGQAQGLEILPKAASLLKEKITNRKICFDIIGDGRYKDALIAQVRSNNVEEMFTFIPSQPPTKIPEFLATGDAAFLSLSDHPIFSMTIPAKLQSYLACGIPIIASVNGESQQIIKDAKAGVSVSSGDVDGLVDKIIELLDMSPEQIVQIGKNARSYYTTNFSKEELLKKMDVQFGGY